MKFSLHSRSVSLARKGVNRQTRNRINHLCMILDRIGVDCGRSGRLRLIAPIYNPIPPDLKLARCPTRSSLLPSSLYLDHSHCPVLAPATLAALPSTRAIPNRDVFYVADPISSIASRPHCKHLPRMTPGFETRSSPNLLVATLATLPSISLVP